MQRLLVASCTSGLPTTHLAPVGPMLVISLVEISELRVVPLLLLGAGHAGCL